MAGGGGQQQFATQTHPRPLARSRYRLRLTPDNRKKLKVRPFCSYFREEAETNIFLSFPNSGPQVRNLYSVTVQQGPKATMTFLLLQCSPFSHKRQKITSEVIQEPLPLKPKMPLCAARRFTKIIPWIETPGKTKEEHVITSIYAFH